MKVSNQIDFYQFTQTQGIIKQQPIQLGSSSLEDGIHQIMIQEKGSATSKSMYMVFGFCLLSSIAGIYFGWSVKKRLECVERECEELPWQAVSFVEGLQIREEQKQQLLKHALLLNRAIGVNQSEKSKQSYLRDLAQDSYCLTLIFQNPLPYVFTLQRILFNTKDKLLAYLNITFMSQLIFSRSLLNCSKLHQPNSKRSLLTYQECDYKVVSFHYVSGIEYSMLNLISRVERVRGFMEQGREWMSFQGFEMERRERAVISFIGMAQQLYLNKFRQQQSFKSISQLALICLQSYSHYQSTLYSLQAYSKSISHTLPPLVTAASLFLTAYLHNHFTQTTSTTNWSILRDRVQMGLGLVLIACSQGAKYANSFYNLLSLQQRQRVKLIFISPTTNYKADQQQGPVNYISNQLDLILDAIKANSYSVLALNHRPVKFEGDPFNHDVIQYLRNYHNQFKSIVDKLTQNIRQRVLGLVSNTFFSMSSFYLQSKVLFYLDSEGLSNNQIWTKVKRQNSNQVGQLKILKIQGSGMYRQVPQLYRITLFYQCTLIQPNKLYTIYAVGEKGSFYQARLYFNTQWLLFRNFLSGSVTPLLAFQVTVLQQKASFQIFETH